MIQELTALAGSEVLPFHMPGHKRQSDGSWIEEIYRYDITEIDDFDNLQDPKGLISDIEKGFAEYYGADKAHLLVNGSTCGILSAISAVVPHRELLLMDRGAHQSAFNAAFLGELRTAYINRATLNGYEISACVSPEEVGRMLKAAEEKKDLPKAVFLTSPTYEGFIADTEKIADMVHDHDIPLIVDGAHGAHLNVSKRADITVVSLHKTLPALTQLSVLLVNGDRVDDTEIKRFINIFQTSSPSYILMASADKCLEHLKEGFGSAKESLDKELYRIYALKSRLRKIDIIGPEYVGKDGIYGYDRSKINLVDRSGKADGQILYDILRKKNGIQPEMAMGADCLLMTSIMDTHESFELLMDAIEAADREI